MSTIMRAAQMTVGASARPVGRQQDAVKTKEFCEFFAGIGLVRAGLEISGWRCIYANDIDPKKAEQYAARFRGDKHYHIGDVWETDAVVSRIKGRPFLATASFPCVDLSLCGHWRGLDGEHSSTFFGFANALTAMGDRMPKVVMLENVTGLINSRGGKDFAAIARILAECGYWLDAFVIDARHFVPQSRPRIFVVGLHDTVSCPLVVKATKEYVLDDPWQRAMDASHQLRPRKLVNLMESIDIATGWMATPIKPPPERRSCLADVIDTDESQEWWDEAQVDKHLSMMSDLHKATVETLLRTSGAHIGTIYRRKRYDKTMAEVRFDGIAGCLRTPRGGSGRQIVIVINDGRVRIRWMSPREYARLQGADDFPLVGKKNQQLFGFGDAVCVPVISWIDKHVLTPLHESVIEE